MDLRFSLGGGKASAVCAHQICGQKGIGLMLNANFLKGFKILRLVKCLQKMSMESFFGVDRPNENELC